jgi:hypothetical protein
VLLVICVNVICALGLSRLSSKPHLTHRVLVKVDIVNMIAFAWPNCLCLFWLLFVLYKIASLLWVWLCEIGCWNILATSFGTMQFNQCRWSGDSQLSFERPRGILCSLTSCSSMCRNLAELRVYLWGWLFMRPLFCAVQASSFVQAYETHSVLVESVLWK